MNRCLSAYTGRTPADDGYVGFVNLSVQPDGTVLFSVRPEGLNPDQAAYALPREEAEKLLREALAAL
jgi:hypothetical protein